MDQGESGSSRAEKGNDGPGPVHGETLPLRLTPAFCKRLLGHPVALDDLATVDPTLHKNQVLYVTQHGPEGLGLTWEDTADPTGVFRPGAMTPLVPGGEAKVGRCRLTLRVSKLVLKADVVSELESTI